MQENVDSRELFVRAAREDQSAWTELVDLYNEKLSEFVRKRMHDTPTVARDDIVQLTWQQIHQSVGTFIESPYDSPLQLIYTIAWRVMVKFFERRHREKQVAEHVAEQVAVVADVSADNNWRETRELEEAMERFAETLGEREATVFNLKCAGHQVAEIAGALELTEPQVKRSLQNIRPKFKKFMEQLGMKV